MRTIAYTSVANRVFSEGDLAELLIRARDKNARLKITGALLFRDGHFIQVIEGPSDAVGAVYADIVANPMHKDIRLVVDEKVSVRRFPAWTMSYQSLEDASGSACPGPENLFGAYAPNSELPTELRQSQSLFDWMYNCWRSPASIPTGPSKAQAGRDLAPAEADEPLLSFDARDATLSSVVAAAAIKSAPGTSVVVTAIVNKIMTDVDLGVLLPGDILRDTSIAKIFGTSRTPVREALQQLRTMGVVESSPNQFTRIALVSPEKATQSIIVLAALYGAVLEEVIGRVDGHVIEAMRGDRVAFNNSIAIGNPMWIATVAAKFYLRLVTESSNPALREAIQNCVQIVKLGGSNLDELIGIAVISASQEVLLAAVIAGDLGAAKRGLRMLTESPAMST